MRFKNLDYKTMPRLMTHLVANFPDPKGYQEALQTMLEFDVDYLEIQLPFNHPVGDGPTIYQANQVALENHLTLQELVQNSAQLKSKIKSKTKLILMTYLTPVLAYGMANLGELLKENDFFGVIIPDLPFGSPEHLELHLANQKLEIIPLISPLTNIDRLNFIKQFLIPNQVVYATARKGQTGNGSDLENPEIQKYFSFLKENLEGFEIAVGFGIANKNQVDFLSKLNFISVIGSEIVRRLEAAQKEVVLYQKAVEGFLHGVLG